MWVIPVAHDAAVLGGCRTGSSSNGHSENGTETQAFTEQFATGKFAAGTLPGFWQTAEGAEAYALLFWLRHLDPASPVQPRYHTDSERVVDGWHRRWDTTAGLAPHRGLWQQIEMARADLPTEVAVVWVPSHRPISGNAEERKVHAFGNRVADGLARAAAQQHAVDGAVEAAARRSHNLAIRLGQFYAKHNLAGNS